MLGMVDKPPKRPKGRPATTGGKRKGKPVNAWVSDWHRAALDALMKRTRHTLKTQLEILIEEAAAKAGLGSPPDADAAD